MFAICMHDYNIVYSYSMVIYLLMWSSLSNLAWPTSVPLPSCSNVSVTCALGCLEGNYEHIDTKS